MKENDLWYKRGVFYALDVETFQDSNNDGIGDFQGLISRLDYISTLGITCIWLLPFYPTPNLDNGYDVSDYYNVDERLGSLGDFAAFIQESKERGIRVVIDLVVNHTSSQHPWFQAARKDPNSEYRDYYIWRKTKPGKPHAEPILKGGNEDIWEYDEVAKEYFLHRFYSHQPDLNISNPAVRKEIHHIMQFWLALGVSGFRVDAAHILVQNHENNGKDEFYDLVEDMRTFIHSHSHGAILLAEATGSRTIVGKFFKGDSRMHMMFSFLLNERLFLAFARSEANPIKEGLEKLPEKSFSSQWLNFLRHHDELNLEGLTAKERNEVFEAFAPEETMRYLGRGIRRRLAPMLDGDLKRMQLAYSLLFSMPGTPLIQYGAEIGMGEDLSRKGRESVRTSMQWSDTDNAGFSVVKNVKLAKPVISTGPFSYKKINVENQRRQPDSLLNWMTRLIGLRRQLPEICHGNCAVLNIRDKGILAHTCSLTSQLLIVHNLSNEAKEVKLKELNQDGISELFSDSFYDLPDKGNVKLEPYGYRWFRLPPITVPTARQSVAKR